MDRSIALHVPKNVKNVLIKMEEVVKFVNQDWIEYLTISLEFVIVKEVSEKNWTILMLME